MQNVLANEVSKNQRITSFDDFMLLLLSHYETQLKFTFHEMLFLFQFLIP